MASGKQRKRRSSKRGDDPASPWYYRLGGIHLWSVVEAYGLGYHLGCVLKYICRAGKKTPGDSLTDLYKAAACLRREIARRERERVD